MYHYKSESPLAENSELKKRKVWVSIWHFTNGTAFTTISSTTGKQKLNDLDKPNKNKEGSFMSNKKIVFCGCGPMGEGILGGLLNNNVAKAKDVTVNELLEVRRTYIAETYGVAAVENASDALEGGRPGHHRGESRADAQGCPDDPPPDQEGMYRDVHRVRRVARCSTTPAHTPPSRSTT